MLTHGFNPEDLLLSTIISIPKDNRGSMNSSDNYRGIFLSNSICKLYDYVFIDLNMDYLKTDDMQFGFKDNHSTVLCTAVYIETINHYMNEGSDVYSCLIDASKAFDRVHWGGGAFSILIEKKVSYRRTNYLLSDSSFTERCAVSNIFNSFFVRCGDNDNGLFSKFLLAEIEKTFIIYIYHTYTTTSRNYR